MLRLNQPGFQVMVTLRKALILLLVLAMSLHLALGQLVVVNECTCPGRELRLQCTVVGGFGTLWTGTAFNCPGRSNQIDLSHARFESGEATGECGMIIGHSLNRTFDGSNSKFTSQLTINLPLLNDTSNTLDGRTVECVRSSLDTIDVVGSHAIAYSRVSSAPLAPNNVHLAQVTKNALTFQWEPVQFICLYKVNADGCGMCPNTTLHASVTCVVNDILTNSAGKNFVCNLSISTTVCGFQSDSSETATAILRAPDRPMISKVLPYYSSTSNQLTKVDIQAEYDSSEERLSISDGIDGSVTSYTFNISFSHSESSCSSSTTLPVSACMAGVCSATLTNLTSQPCYKNDSQAEVAVYASNVLTDGPSSMTILNTSNDLFFVKYEPLNHTFSCRFVGHHGYKSCEVTYGPVDPAEQICRLDIRLVNSSMISNTVTVVLPRLKNAESEFCFTAIGKTEAFSIAVEGTFKTGNQPINDSLQIDALSVILITFTVLLAATSVILTIVIVLLARSRARALNELKLLRENRRMQNVAYEEINLTPSDINTSENVAYGHISN